MKATVNADTCIGCELCANECPEVFKMTDGKAVVIADPLVSAQEDCAKGTAQNCPVTAIEVK